MVRARLTEDDDSIKPKKQWPQIDTCYQCYNNETALKKYGIKNEKVLKLNDVLTKLKSNENYNNQVLYEEEEWNQEYIFSFLQETFCVGSDTFVCEGFIDKES